MKQFFECEKCNARFDNWREADNCENSHKMPSYSDSARQAVTNYAVFDTVIPSLPQSIVMAFHTSDDENGNEILTYCEYVRKTKSIELSAFSRKVADDVAIEKAEQDTWYAKYYADKNASENATQDACKRFY